MTYQATRTALHAYLTEGAHVTLQNYADVHGVSLTGLMQALAEDLRAEIDAVGHDNVRTEWVTKARRVDAQRRRRQSPKAHKARV